MEDEELDFGDGDANNAFDEDYLEALEGIELIPDDPVYRRLGEYDQTVTTLRQCLDAGITVLRLPSLQADLKENAEAYVSSALVSLRQVMDDLCAYTRSFDNDENRRPSGQPEEQ